MPYGDNRRGDSTAVINVTASTISLTTAVHDGRLITLNRAAGITVTLPASEGSGAMFRIVTETTVTSGGNIVEVANGSDSFFGWAYGVDTDSEGATGYTWNADASDDTITLDGSAKGGIAGDLIEVEDFAVNKWLIRAYITQSGGSEVTPFNAAVS